MPELAGQGIVVAPSPISRWLIRNGYRFKKNASGQRAGSSRRRSRVPGLSRPPAQERLEHHHLVFIDETGATIK